MAFSDDTPKKRLQCVAAALCWGVCPANFTHNGLTLSVPAATTCTRTYNTKYIQLKIK